MERLRDPPAKRKRIRTEQQPNSFAKKIWSYARSITNDHNKKIVLLGDDIQLEEKDWFWDQHKQTWRMESTSRICDKNLLPNPYMKWVKER